MSMDENFKISVSVDVGPFPATGPRVFYFDGYFDQKYWDWETIKAYVVSAARRVFLDVEKKMGCDEK